MAPTPGSAALPERQPPPPSLPVPHRPVYTLVDYRNAVPGPAFPDNAVALTIDDGPHPVWTPKVLGLLDRYHVPALFCLNGDQVLGHENVARSVVNAGHQAANHTWSHPTSLPHQPNDGNHQEIQRTQTKIYDTTGCTRRCSAPPAATGRRPSPCCKRSSRPCSRGYHFVALDGRPN